MDDISEDIDLPQDVTDSVEIIYLDEEDFDDNDDENTDLMGQEVLSEVIDLSKLSFNKHTKSVFCCDLSKDGTLAITGGEDDLAYLWSTSNGEVLLECTGHKDSVTEVHFNFDSQYVATGDMSGLIQVWNVLEKKLLWCNEDDDMDWMRWHPSTNALCVGSQSGDVYVWQIPQGNCKVLPSHGFSTTCGMVVPSDEKRILVGYSDGQVKLWDIRSAAPVWQLEQPQTQGITSLDIHANGTLAITAPSGHLIKLTDGKTISSLSPTTNTSESDIESVLFQPELNLLVTGSLTGQLCVYDLAHNNALRHQASIDGAVTQLRIDRSNAGRVLVASTDGAIYECDMRTGLLVQTWTGHLSDVLSVCVETGGQLAVSTSDDCAAKIWHLGPF